VAVILLWIYGKTRSNLVFTGKSIHLNELVMVVEDQLDACQKVLHWFLVLQTIPLSMVLPTTLQRLHRQTNIAEVKYPKSNHISIIFKKLEVILFLAVLYSFVLLSERNLLNLLDTYYAQIVHSMPYMNLHNVMAWQDKAWTTSL